MTGFNIFCTLVGYALIVYGLIVNAQINSQNTSTKFVFAAAPWSYIVIGCALQAVAFGIK
jgi:hypothetical protein